MKQTVVGAFDQYATARQAADVLASRGIARDHIRVQASDSADSGYRSSSTASGDRHEEHGVTASVRHFFSDVFGSDRGHEDIDQYAENVKRGGAVVAVDVDDSDGMQVSEVCRELKNAGAIDLDERADEWRASGWKGRADEDRTADMRRDTGDRASGEQVIPVVQEDIEIGKRVVEQGGIRVYTHVVEQPVHESVDLRTEKAVVERTRVDRPLSDADAAAFQDRTIEVRETSEKAVVNKTAHVVEEVRVGKEVQHQTQEVNDTVRRTEVDVQRLDGDTAQRDLEHRDLGNDVHAREYREHWNRNHASTGGSYDDYDPAYRYGHSLASDARYRDQDWDRMEPSVRRDWEARNPGSSWDRMKDSVRHAWERAKH